MVDTFQEDITEEDIPKISLKLDTTTTPTKHVTAPPAKLADKTKSLSIENTDTHESSTPVASSHEIDAPSIAAPVTFTSDDLDAFFGFSLASSSVDNPVESSKV
jgi:hypothetical protein